ncbi:MAG: hypothetical protein IPJ30_04590 [Acidobacteria bacterium]|nr:hypothetical protein [Acidobacteriota bacterium]
MNRSNEEKFQEKGRWIEFARDSIIVIVTILFVGLYAAAYSGKLDPLRDSTMLMRLEPLIFNPARYYFARFPSRQVERTLSAEIARLTSRTDVAQFAKEKANEEREVIEEKLRNVRVALSSNSDISAGSGSWTN